MRGFRQVEPGGGRESKNVPRENKPRWLGIWVLGRLNQVGEGDKSREQDRKGLKYEHRGRTSRWTAGRGRDHRGSGLHETGKFSICAIGQTMKCCS